LLSGRDVLCDERDRAHRYAKHFPTVTIEVLSPSTEGIDRGKKARAYRRCESLAEYVFVATDRPWIEVYRRDAGFWVLRESGPGEPVTLAGIQATIDHSTIYEDVDWSVPEDDESV
jgi:Uma2 family endonuclease